jgi:hypothetical protein
MSGPNRFLPGRLNLLLALALGALVVLPTLRAGFDHDETAQLGSLEGVPRIGGARVHPLDLWSFSDGTPEELDSIRRRVHGGELPWCTPVDAPPPRMRFLRVLPSATLWLDHALFGLEPLGYHVHTAAWFVALAVLVATLLERTLAERTARRGWRPDLATLALVLFLLDATHVETVSRIATRHFLIGACFGVAGLLAHLRWRERPTLAGARVAGAAFALALLSSESALQVMAYVVAFELARAGEPWRHRLCAAAPALALGALYLALHRVAGFGARGAGYIDALAEAPVLLRAAPGRLADLVNEELLAIPAWRGWFHSPWRLVGLELPEPARVALAALLLAATAWIVSRATRAASAGSASTARGLVGGGLLALAPALVGQPGPRLLLIPSIAAAAAVALAAGHAWRLWQHRGSRTRAAPLALAVAALLALRLIASPLALASQLATHRRITTAVVERWLPARAAPLPPGGAGGAAGAPPEDVVVLVAPSTTVPDTFLPALRCALDGTSVVERRPGQRWTYLSNNALDFGHALVRTGTDSFELLLDGPRRPDPITNTLWMGCREKRTGDVATLESLRVTVLDATADGRIRRVGVELERRLDDPRVWLVTWRDGALRRVAPPRTGERVALD